MFLLGNYGSDMFRPQLLAIFRDFSTSAAHSSTYVAESVNILLKLLLKYYKLYISL